MSWLSPPGPVRPCLHIAAAIVHLGARPLVRRRNLNGTGQRETGLFAGE